MINVAIIHNSARRVQSSLAGCQRPVLEGQQMKWLIACATLLAMSFSMIGTASAMTGADAAAACKKLKGCALAMNKDGSNIDIITPDNHYIRCENLKARPAQGSDGETARHRADEQRGDGALDLPRSLAHSPVAPTEVGAHPGRPPTHRRSGGNPGFSPGRHRGELKKEDAPGGASSQIKPQRRGCARPVRAIAGARTWRCRRR